MSFVHRHSVSFKHALEGIIYQVKTQPNFRIHILAALIVVAAGIIFKISPIEWLVLTFIICLVLIAESINTSIESVVDLLTDKYHLQAKIAKDVSAGMVLITAITSIIIAFIIFSPHIIR
jgi:diacylglycerol kinase